LSQGAYKAAQVVGRGTEALVMHVKGQEIPMHEPRVKYGLGLGYAASPTGADHMHNFHDRDFSSEEGMADMHPFGILEPLPYNDLSPDKVRLGVAAIVWRAMCNAVGHCMFVTSTFPPLRVVEMVQAITGWDTSLYELLKVGERAYTMARAFNAREGFTAEQDVLPDRFFQPFQEGPSQGNALPRDEFARARTTFYQMMGWDEQTAVPHVWKLQELGVGWVADKLRRSRELN